MRGWLPAWMRDYRRQWLAQDGVAGLVVAVMLVPQSLGYAMLAGLPPHVGLYASILPLLAYAAFGSSTTLAVGPVAVSSIMTASVVAALGASPDEAVALAAMLALLVGGFLMLGGLLRLGFIANLLSHPVISGFTTGSAVLIIISQLAPLLGITGKGGQGSSAVDKLQALAGSLPTAAIIPAMLGGATLLLLWAARTKLSALLQQAGLAQKTANLLARLAPMALVMGASWLTAALSLDTRHGVAVVGAIPRSLPDLGLPVVSMAHVQALILPALLIAIVNYVESVSVAQSLAMQRRERIDPDAELRGLGAANLASAVSGGFPVAGGFARSAVSFAAGMRTQMAAIVSAALILLVILGPAQVFERLPIAVLAATIVFAVSPLIDLTLLRKAWRYDRSDAVAYAGTAAGVLILGVEQGILAGVALSLGTFVWRSSRPHMAVVGRVPGTEHFRNIERHQVETLPGMVALRIDENLLFSNARAVEERILAEVRAHRDTRDLLLVMSSVSQIDTTGLDTLEGLARDLAGRGIRLSLAEVKGPVQDRLQRSELPALIEGRLYLSTHQAFEACEVRDRSGGAADSTGSEHRINPVSPA